MYDSLTIPSSELRLHDVLPRVGPQTWIEVTTLTYLPDNKIQITGRDELHDPFSITVPVDSPVAIWRPR